MNKPGRCFVEKNKNTSPPRGLSVAGREGTDYRQPAQELARHDSPVPDGRQTDRRPEGCLHGGKLKIIEYNNNTEYDIVITRELRIRNRVNPRYRAL